MCALCVHSDLFGTAWCSVAFSTSEPEYQVTGSARWGGWAISEQRTKQMCNQRPTLTYRGEVSLDEETAQHTLVFSTD